MYTCGPTVYDYAHIGNFRTYVFQDMLRRYLEYKGYRVIQVTNITDVDDKTIQQAQAQGTSLSEYTKKYEKAYFQDIAALSIKRSEHYPRATEHIDDIVALVWKLMRKRVAYNSGGSVYFDISKFRRYGRLSGACLGGLKAGARVDQDKYSKDEARDFVLWKSWRAEDGDVFWETRLGKGRPGWHIECSAMSMKYLGATLDIHSGGEDLIFPHHENEIAQSEAATGRKFVKYWMHSGMLLVGKKKMAKSMGNFCTLRELLDKGFRPKAVRYLLMSAHYRAQLSFSEEALRDAEKSLEALSSTIQRLRDLHPQTRRSNRELRKVLVTQEAAFEKAMDDDLNTPRALAALYKIARAINRALEREAISKSDASAALKLVSQLNSVFGVFDEEGQAVVISDKAQRLIKQREEARAGRDWTTADRLRDELSAMGITIEDTPSGTVWKTRAR